MIPIGPKERTEVFNKVADLTAKRLFAPSFDKKKWAELVATLAENKFLRRRQSRNLKARSANCLPS